MNTEMNTVTKKAAFPILTKNDNTYIYDGNKKKILCCHPIVYSLSLMLENGADPEAWMAENEKSPADSIKLPEGGVYKKNELSYYFKKFQMLRASGYLSAEKPKGNTYQPLTDDDVSRQMANLNQLVFEVTEACNMSCDYCGYGKFYHHSDTRAQKSFDFESALKALDYIKTWKESHLNISHDKNFYVGFYGGEPLTDFGFIEKVVGHIRRNPWKHNPVTFTITTNGVLLDKYIHFLVENSFHLLISLDGNESCNSYRVLKNREPSFPMVLNNIRAVQANYPEYFSAKVNFNAVLHNRNSVAEIYHFFKTTFGKAPRISALNDSGIRGDMEAEFWKTYANVTESLFNSEDYSHIQQDLFIALPSVQAVSSFIHKEIDNFFDHYNDLIYEPAKGYNFPTGTCLPFSKKFFITAAGLILPCERISHEYSLGLCNRQGVHIDFHAVADKYNYWSGQFREQCNLCYNQSLCTQCMFYLNPEQERPLCKNPFNKERFRHYIKSMIEYLEENPAMYERIVKEVIID